MTYTAPIDDMRFVLNALCDMEGLAALPYFAETSPDVVDQILDQAASVAGQVFAPLNQSGDRQGAILENGVVRTPDGYCEAYRIYAEGAWNAVAQRPENGGMGLPYALGMAVQEMWQSANMGLGLSPLLNQSAAMALTAHGSASQKRLYLPRMVTGQWAGTMDMTEPQAGSDVGAVRTQAVRDGDHYRIKGQKIFISYGDHDMAENIVHLVLARVPDAPSGTKGLSLFLVSKYLVNEDGSLGPANDMRPVSLEEKLGLHGSPTCVMSYGENEGAIGYLIGEEGSGMACMFAMMNITRLGTGIQGIGIAERAYQRACAYARDRVQSARSGSGDPTPVAIINHPDVKRMLLTMRALTQAMRAIAYCCIAAFDFSHGVDDGDLRAGHEQRVALLTPVVKAWCTDLGFEVASLGVQVHGGAGYIEESGAAQHLRDVRICSIYEGTNGIQALDLLGRKILRDEGAALADLVAEMRATVDSAKGSVETMAGLKTGLDDLERATAWILQQDEATRDHAVANALPFLHLLGTVTGGWLLAKAAVAAGDPDSSATVEFAAAKQATAAFYATNIMPRSRSLAEQVVKGGASVMAFDDALF